MNRSILVRIFGFAGTLIHGDTLVVDRWRWLRARLPRTRNGEKLIDVGCGTGAFAIGMALRGYDTLGMSWNERNQGVATTRAAMCKAEKARFEVLDVRELDAREDLNGEFDVATCTECIEHILDDRKLMQDIARCLKPGGKLLLTSPYDRYVPISRSEEGPFSKEEDGGHVRRGYSPAMYRELCEEAGLTLENVSYCSGYLSQKLTRLMRAVSRIHPILGWLAVLPFRPLPILLDRWVTPALNWPRFSICMEAVKPRFAKEGRSRAPLVEKGAFAEI